MSITAGKAISAVLVLGATSVLGYNWVTTGCPTGVCPSSKAAKNTAAISTVALPGSEAQTKDACCSLTAESATTTEVALPACCAELGHAACGDASQCTDMAAPAEAPAAETAANTTP
jgi:hypothetical protein